MSADQPHRCTICVSGRTFGGFTCEVNLLDIISMPLVSEAVRGALKAHLLAANLHGLAQKADGMMLTLVQTDRHQGSTVFVQETYDNHR